MNLLISEGISQPVNGATLFIQNPDFAGLQPSWNQAQTQGLITLVVIDNFSLHQDKNFVIVSWQGG